METACRRHPLAFSSDDFASWQNVDRLGRLHGSPEAAVGFAHDTLGLELGVSAFAGRLRVGDGQSDIHQISH